MAGAGVVVEAGSCRPGAGREKPPNRERALPVVV